MELRLFQIVVIIFSLGIGVYIVGSFRSAKIRLLEMVVSILILTAFFCLAMFPDAISNTLARWLGIKNNINAILFGGIVLSLWLNFRLWVLIREQDRRISQLNRNIALREKAKPESPPKSP